MPIPAAALPQQTGSDQLFKLMEAMITCLESHRRDELDPARSKQLHRFIKRIRKAGYDLKDILETAQHLWVGKAVADWPVNAPSNQLKVRQLPFVLRR